MEWIDTYQDLPEEGQHCWIHPREGKLTSGTFSKEIMMLVSHEYTGYQCEKGWEVDFEPYEPLSIMDVAHWMPYYVPEAPQTDCQP